MRVCVPVTADGKVDPRWGRASRVAVADVADGGIRDWQEFAVDWDVLHDQGTEGAHHARIARFLRTTRSRRSPPPTRGPASSACSARWRSGSSPGWAVTPGARHVRPGDRRRILACEPAPDTDMVSGAHRTGASACSCHAGRIDSEPH